MKPSPMMIAVAYAAAILQMLAVFHKPIGLADAPANILQVVSLVCWIIFFALWKRQKSTLVAAGEIPQPVRQSKGMMWLTLSVLILASLSSYFWLPYTGVDISSTQLIVVPIITCIFSVAAFLIARRIMSPKI
jgi:hypothetical protein